MVTEAEMKQLQELQDMYGEEELDPELEPYLEDGGESFATLRHPLVYAVPYMPYLNKHLNAMLTRKHELLNESIANKDYSTFVFAHERPYRLNAMHKVIAMGEHIPDQEYWGLLSDIWGDTENFWQNRTDWYEMFTERTTGREHFMTKEERKVFDALPDVIHMYRGAHHADSLTGLSYTLDRDKAEWFATRLYEKDNANLLPKVLAVSVRKEKAIGYLEGRGEQEIVALPWDIALSHIIVVNLQEK